MSAVEEHPHRDFAWGCPDCGSTDIGKPGSNTVRSPQPAYACHACGIRFASPAEVRV